MARYAIIDTDTGDWIGGPYDDAPVLAAGQSLVSDVPLSFDSGKSVWSPTMRGFVDPVPPVPALHQLCDMLVAAGTITLAQSDAIKAA